jgi:hypothetical protein
MRKLAFVLLFLFSAFQSLHPQTNDFYDDAPIINLHVPKVEVAGEIANLGNVDFSMLPLHSVIYKETQLQGDSTVFVGAYRYEGYSIYDILNDRILKKKNESEFSPIIDLYVEVENAKGDKVVLSWGEIYYPAQRHQIIIATQVARIVPSKTKDLWPLPDEPKLVVGQDLISERNISSPVKITVKSYPVSFRVNREMDTLFSPEIKIFFREQFKGALSGFPVHIPIQHYPTVFYGRGRGIHGISTFTGVPLDEILDKQYPVSEENLKQGMLAIVAIDGYRCAFSYSEIFNRNDQQNLLLVDRKDDMDGGAFSVFPAADFFSDRAVKAISEIHFYLIGDF